MVKFARDLLVLRPGYGARGLTRRGGIAKARLPARTRSRVALRKAAGSKTASKLMYYQEKKRNPMRRRVIQSKAGGAGSFSRFVLNGRPNARARAMKKVGAANYQVENVGTHIACLEGFQNAQTFAFNNLAVLKTIASHVPNSMDIPDPGWSTSQVKQYLLESCTGEYLITNSTNATVYVDIYDIIRKRDTGKPDAQSPGYNPTSNPQNAWGQGVLDENGGGNVDAWKNINSIPTDSRLFKDYFAVKKRSHIALQVGATHRHMVRLTPNRLIDTAVLDNVTGDMAGLAVYTMIAFYGQPVSSVDKESGASATTTAHCALDIVYAGRYKYTWVADQTNTFYYNDNLVSLPVEEIFNTASGLADVVSTLPT